MLLRRYSILINLAVISLIAWAASNIFLTIISSKLEVSPRAKVIDTLEKPAKVVKHPLRFYSVIAEKNIFNPSAEKKSNKKETSYSKKVTEERPITKLNLALKGTITGDSKDSFAIIEDKDKRKQDLYRLNDTVKDATVMKILEDRVILMRNGQEEILSISYEKVSPKREADKRKISRPVERISSTKYVLDREAVNSTLGNLNQFMTQLNVKPYLEFGKPAGFQISRIKPGSLISKMGLRNGDIIKSVNNMTIDNPEQAIGVYQQLQNESSFSIEVERRKKRKTFQYEIK